MSTEEQYAAIGRLSAEKSNLRREVALLRDNIATMADICGKIHGSVRGPSPILDAVNGKVEEIQRIGGLDKLPTWIYQLRIQEIRIAEIEATLRDAGVQ